MNYLVVGTDEACRQTIAGVLETELYAEQVLVAEAEDQARDLAGKTKADLVVWMAGPDLDSSLDQLRAFKKCAEAATTPVIVVCHQDAAASLLAKGFGPGSVDYIARPFEPEQLVFRVQSLQRGLRREDLLNSELVKWGFKEAQSKRSMADGRRRIADLKKEVDGLLRELGRPARYEVDA